MNWTCHTSSLGRRSWTLDGTDYSIESTGSWTGGVKSGASNGKRVRGGYRAYRGEQGLGLHSTVAAAKARAERDLAVRSVQA